MTLITGGRFSDFAGNPIANGTLKVRLGQDVNAIDGTIVGAGWLASVPLDSNGNVTPFQLWSSAEINPSVPYRFKVFTPAGQEVFNQEIFVLDGPTFDLGGASYATISY
jgi:hypothetical protein